MPENPGRALVAEAIGTFTLCFVGILAINNAPGGGLGLTAVALAHGLAILVMVAALGALSGGHFNPAVTFGFMVTRRMTPQRGLMYWGAQLGGAVLAGLLLRWLIGADAVEGGTPGLATLDPVTGIVLEAVATFFLVLVVFGTAVDERAPKSVYPIAIGLTVTLDILAVGPLTGAAMNPARAFGPALAAGAWTDQWVYWVGPLLGGAAAALLQSGYLMARTPTPPVAEQGGPTLAEERGTV
jgi:aquaporin TIP